MPKQNLVSNFSALMLTPWKLNPETGLVEGVDHDLSPNCDDRPAGIPIDLLVIHNISLPPGQFDHDFVLAFFTNQLEANQHPYFETIKDLRVSAHFFIRREGHIFQLVPCHRRAWHAGKSHWQGKEQCNDFSIGIEVEGTDVLPYTDQQYDTLGRLTALLETHYPIGDRVGHDQISPGRKTDPGPAFDWDRYSASVKKYALAPAGFTDQ